MTDEELKEKKERIARGRVKICHKYSANMDCPMCCGKEYCDRYKKAQLEWSKP